MPVDQHTNLLTDWLLLSVQFSLMLWTQPTSLPYHLVIYWPCIDHWCLHDKHVSHRNTCFTSLSTLPYLWGRQLPTQYTLHSNIIKPILVTLQIFIRTAISNIHNFCWLAFSEIWVLEFCNKMAGITIWWLAKITCIQYNTYGINKNYNNKNL